jgi:DNA-directed RNA polymerase specialized sigma24 family protein
MTTIRRYFEENNELLRRIGAKEFANWQNAVATLQATALVDEAYLRLIRLQDKEMPDQQALRMICQNMRWFLADYYRKQKARRPRAENSPGDNGRSEAELKREGLKNVGLFLEALAKEKHSNPYEWCVKNEEDHMMWNVYMDKLENDDPDAHEVVEVYASGEFDTFDKLATFLGSPRATVCDRLNRGVKKLKEYHAEASA